MADDEVRHWKSLKKTEAAAVGFRQQVCSQEPPPLGATIRMKRQGFTGTVDLLRGRLQLRVRGDDEALTSGSRYLPSSSKRTRPQLCLCRSQTIECRLLLSQTTCVCRRRDPAFLGIRDARWLSQGDLQLEVPVPRSRLLRRLGGVESNHVLPRPANAEGVPRIAGRIVPICAFLPLGFLVKVNRRR